MKKIDYGAGVGMQFETVQGKQKILTCEGVIRAGAKDGFCRSRVGRKSVILNRSECATRLKTRSVRADSSSGAAL